MEVVLLSSTVASGVSSALNGLFLIFIFYSPPKHLGCYKGNYYLGSFTSLLFAFTHFLCGYVCFFYNAKPRFQNLCERQLSDILYRRHHSLVSYRSKIRRCNFYFISRCSQRSFYHIRVQFRSPIRIDKQVRSMNYMYGN